MKYGEEVDLALVDADILVYRAAFAAQKDVFTVVYNGKEIEFVGKLEYNKWRKEKTEQKGFVPQYTVEQTLRIEPISFALQTVKGMVSNILEATKPKDIVFFLTGKGNFRDDIATIAKYKGNRDKMVKPHYYLKMREYLMSYYDTTVVDGMEADDALADAQTDKTVLCSIDKDLLQVPGKHYNWNTEKKLFVTPESGLRALWQQVLTGDSTDNIPGIHKVGIVTAKKILKELTTEEEMRDMCVLQWCNYMEGPNAPDWVTDDTDPETVVEEVYQLLKVGRR
jgi:5'-3' exonuclease